jgi:hypothetical protein
MNTNENNENKQSALKTMVEKLDNRQPGSLGYATKLPELQAILSELTPRVSVAILESHSSIDRDGDISVEVKLGFTLERSLL